MNMKKTTIKTNAIKNSFFTTLLILILIYFIVFLSILIPNVSVPDLPQTLDKENFLILAALSEVMALPIQVIFLVVRLIKNKNNKENATYIATQGIEYHRDKLTGLTPGMISFLTNLKFEKEKDLNSMIMYYELLGVIEKTNNKIIVKNYNHPKLTDSDKKLLTYLSNPEKEEEQYISWTYAETQKCLEKGYITKKGFNYYFKSIVKLVIGSLIVGWLLTFAASIVLQLLSENIFLSTEVSAETKNFVLTIVLIACVILAIIEMALTFGGPIFLITSFVTKSPYKRTELGNQLTEQIHGLKRFIKDFSNLEEATKKELILWEDFLIYAVVLEENTRIIEEITYYQNSNY